MDFTYHYTDEQERFRAEVRAWLEENVPDKMTLPLDEATLTDEQYAFARELDKKLAPKGWLFPTMPKEYGGGGMTVEYGNIIEEEFDRKRMVSPVSQVPAALIVWGTEEQKEKHLRPIMTGEKTAVTLLTEPKGGADLAGLESTAVRDGDDWLMTGTKCFITHPRHPDLMFGPMITDPDAPRHRNLGYFIIEVPSPGLALQEMELLVGSEQHFIFMDNVRVSGENLLGGDHQGWQVTQTALHGGAVGAPFVKDAIHDWSGKFPWVDMVRYLQETERHGESVGKDPVLQQQALDAYLDGHICTLFAQRNYWMYQGGMDMGYQGQEEDVHKREFCHRNLSRIRDVFGMYTHLNGADPRAPLGGLPDASGRHEMTSQHGHGSINISKVVLARRLGISRTQERAPALPPPPPSASS